MQHEFDDVTCERFHEVAISIGSGDAIFMLFYLNRHMLLFFYAINNLLASVTYRYYPMSLFLKCNQAKGISQLCVPSFWSNANFLFKRQIIHYQRMNEMTLNFMWFLPFLK